MRGLDVGQMGLHELLQHRESTPPVARRSESAA
jgi:hypothetical protein